MAFISGEEILASKPVLLTRRLEEELVIFSRKGINFITVLMFCIREEDQSGLWEKRRRDQ